MSQSQLGAEIFKRDDFISEFKRTKQENSEAITGAELSPKESWVLVRTSSNSKKPDNEFGIKETLSGKIVLSISIYPTKEAAVSNFYANREYFAGNV